MLFITPDENSRLEHESLETFRFRNMKALIEESSRGAVTSAKCAAWQNNVMTYISRCLNQADIE